MIVPEDIRELLNARPFKPFRVGLSDGREFVVPHPEFAWLIGGQLFVATPRRGRESNDYSIGRLSVLHITRLEDTRQHGRRNGATRSK
ncbi:MAG: hypothetical protein FJ399_02245 [Verrucomicrobia bacterium]|nr:hypothetical protein [Verrucomicrobiota bacterium]